MRIVDEYFIMQTKIFKYSDIPIHLHGEIYKSCLSLCDKIVSYLKVGKWRRKFFSFITCGMVKSGKPTETTLGNTLRVISFLEFVCWLAVIPKDAYFLFVAGDDILFLIEE